MISTLAANNLDIISHLVNVGVCDGLVALLRKFKTADGKGKDSVLKWVLWAIGNLATPVELSLTYIGNKSAAAKLGEVNACEMTIEILSTNMYDVELGQWALRAIGNLAKYSGNQMRFKGVKAAGIVEEWSTLHTGLDVTGQQWLVAAKEALRDRGY